MWKGHLLELVGLGLIVTAFMHHDSSTTAWVYAGSGGLIAVVGSSLWHRTPRRGLVANILGVALMVMALIPPLRSHACAIWIAPIAGVVAWSLGRKVVASESGGPWRLKDRPIY